MSERVSIRNAEVVLPCADLDAALAFYIERLGFRLDAIFPADAPRVAVVSGFGLRVRLERGSSNAPGELRLACDAPVEAAELTDPGGNRVVFVEAQAELALPSTPGSFVLTRASGEHGWNAGRAGMQYRDLLPDRQGGRVIASHIRIPAGGPVPDYVHHHAVRFQTIFCRRGWVRVVYEDQGEPFVLQAGDCVLQPPHIRHRVLESSPGLEVVEVGSPAEHETLVDHELQLPTGRVDPERDFGGQRFVRHEARHARWSPWRVPGFESRDTGIAAATSGLASVCVVRATGDPKPTTHRQDAQLVFLFVLAGAMTLRRAGCADERLEIDDALVVPAGMQHAFADASADLELLEVTMPARFRTEIERAG